MKLKLSPLLASVALIALASAANAGQPLTDRQMDGVTAGLGNNLQAIANVAAIALGNFSSDTVSITNTIADQSLGVALAEAEGSTLGESAITASFVVVGANAAASGAFN